MRRPTRSRSSADLASAWIALTAAVSILALAPAASSARPSSHAASSRAACCRIPAGTPVVVELMEPVSTTKQKQGDTFALRLAAPLIIDGRVLLRAGAPGVGKVIQASGPGIGGKGGKMVLAASYLVGPRGQVPLDALQIAGSGHDNSTASQILGVGGIAYGPLSFVGIVIPGGDVMFKPGSVAAARVAADTVLTPLGRATPADLAEVAGADDRLAPDVASAIALPPPSPGLGRVVFFRPWSVLGIAQWFNVREDGKALGKLNNGAYFVMDESPGVHTYTAKFEPELKDHLKIEVDAGQTYYVEGSLTGGLVLSAADLAPSTVERFNKAAKHLKLATPPEEEKPALAAGDANAAAPPPQ